ncbi:uncharacterized protein TM35_000292300 [Trypanosoma theileri]|uniref:Uncharacterized protein n=1 Tax=Trypanosoma theileri TaxID=67003 RepID=A0A1X0NPA4_9TRYP|nr:uncharacterized protein TM35_000292300 [Trypanosoma theileri]ORC86348.1 hypothetical protein TM35_000292300 [Trypanosoma theileri]
MKSGVSCMRRVCSAPLVFSATTSLRCGSSSPWIARLLYGSSTTPLFGLRSTTYAWSKGDGTNVQDTKTVQEENDAARVLYCKALIHACGGGRLARDWVAGYSALVCSSEPLLVLALRHNGTEQDLERYRNHLLANLNSSRAKNDNNNHDNSNQNNNSNYNSNSSSSNSSTATLEQLGDLPEVRCFVYDAMRAAAFHRRHKVPEEERQRLYAVARSFGLPEDTARGLWWVVEKEGAIEREKQRAFDHPWCE